MMRMGIIGAENSHTAAIAKLLNEDKAVKGFQVTHLWGESPTFVKASQAKVEIPHVVKKPADMLGEVDCVMVDHRHGKHHLKAVTPFVKEKVPVFVDKPMSTSLAECKRFLALRKRKRTPVVTMSSIPHQSCVKTIKKQLKDVGEVKAVHLMGPGDPKSKYGGVFFYGIHQADLMVELCGPGAQQVSAVRNGASMTATVTYPENLNVTISMVPAGGGFRLAASGAKGGFYEPIVSDKNAYLVTTKIFTRMFRTRKEPFTEERMLAPIAVLTAMDKSLKEKRPIKVPKV